MNFYVKTNTGAIHFFHDAHKGICYRNAVSPVRTEALFAEAEDDFDLLCDQQGRIYLICQSKAGEIIYFVQNAGQWHRQVILKSKNATAAASQFKLLANEDGVHLFYLLRHNDEILLVRQPLPSGQPEAVARLSQPRFLARRDEAGCLYLLYPSIDHDGEYVLSVYRFGNWNPPRPIGGGYTVEDAQFTGYMTAHLSLFKNNNLFYATLGENGLDMPVHIAMSKRPASVLLFYEDTLWVLFDQNGALYYWKKSERPFTPSRIISSAYPQLFQVRLIDGMEFEIGGQCYGNLVQNRVNLYILSNLERKKDAPSKTVPDSTSIELTKRTLRTEAALQTVSQNLSQLAKEVAKLSIRLDELDRQVKSQYRAAVASQSAQAMAFFGDAPSFSQPDTAMRQSVAQQDVDVQQIPAIPQDDAEPQPGSELQLETGTSETENQKMDNYGE